MKTKIIPVVLALIAGFITCVIAYLNGLSPRAFVKVLCLVVVIFLVLGLIWEIILERAFPPKEEPQPEEEAEEGAEDTVGEEEENPSREQTEVTRAGDEEEW